MTGSLLLGLSGCGSKVVNSTLEFSKEDTRVEDTRVIVIDYKQISLDGFEETPKNIFIHVYSKLIQHIENASINNIKKILKRKGENVSYLMKQIFYNYKNSELTIFLFFDMRNYTLNQYEQYITIPNTIKLCLKAKNINQYFWYFQKLIAKEKVQIVVCSKGQAAYNHRLINLCPETQEQQEVQICQIRRKQFPWGKCYVY